MTPISDMVERMLSEGAPAVAIVAAVRAVEEIKKDAGLFDEPDPSEPERELFKRGRAILGKTAGGQIAKLKAACGGNVALARSRLELAATKDRPSEFIAGIIRNGDRSGERNSGVYSNTSSEQSGSSAVIAGVVAATERRARERASIGRNGTPSNSSDSTTRNDLESLREIRGFTSYRSA